MAEFVPVSPAFEPQTTAATTNLGSSELHRAHSVRIEGGTIPRAQVMDQHLIDRYLMHGLLDKAQHRAGEYLLKQASRAGVWPTGVDLSGSGSHDGLHNYVPFGAFPFGRTIVIVKRRYGDFHAYIVREVVCHEYDISHDDYRMDCLREGLDVIDQRRLRGRSLNRFRQVTKKKATNNVVALPSTG